MNQYKKLIRRFLPISCFIALISIFVSTANAAGEVDQSFNASAYGTTGGTVQVIKIQPDGKILIGGVFTDVNGQAGNGISRVNPDGSIDTSFNPPVFFNGGFLGANVVAIGLQSDGKILVGGDIYGTDGVFSPGIKRLNPNGTLDTSFNIALGPGSAGFDIVVLPDDKFLAQGQNNGLYRYNANGTVDNTFSSTAGGRDFEVQPDGKILLALGNGAGGGGGGVARVNADGSADSTFPVVSTNKSVEVVKVLPDGKILLGGGFTTVNGFQQGEISRLNADGTLDLNFNLNNPGAFGLFYGINDIAVLPDGKIIIGGDFTSYNSVNIKSIARLNSDGTLDTSFPNNTTVAQTWVFDVEPQADGKILVGAQTFFGAAFPTEALMRLNSDGTSDTAFIVRARRLGKVQKVLQQPDGKILICGEFPFVNGVVRQSLARLNTDGTLDLSFVPYFNGTFSNTPVIPAMALQPDGKILVYVNNAIRRLHPNGSHDTTFNTSGLNNPLDIAVLPDGKVLVGGGSGTSNNKVIERLNANGAPDSSFVALQANGAVSKVLVQPDGKILIGGSFTNIAATLRGRIARLNADGSLDATFNPPGGANDIVYDLDLQSNGKIILVGNFTGLNGNSNIQKVGRLNVDGSLDLSFVQTTNATLLAVKIQPDGKILIGGSMSTVGNQSRVGIARLNSNGSFDVSFSGTANSTVWDINLQTNGRILLGGEFTKVNGVSAVRIARLLNASAPLTTLFDFDGDGRADVSVFRPSTNRWYELLSSNSNVTEQTFGIAGDVVAPADYDGDGKTDIGIFRPSSGDWWYLSSINNTQNFVHWGASGDIPRPGDFDSDGKADFIVFRPSDNTWYRLGTTQAVSIIPFGLAGDKAVRGDFDGDGKVDPAIFRPSTGDWWYQSSINNAQLAVRWGISTDIPAPADFDGDGKTDFAVYRASTGTWYIINSSNSSFTIMNFGISEDKPVPADYDGDGKSDIAVFRPSTGVWYVMMSSAGFTSLQFGISTDVPAPNAFVP